jgi:hypothetical protein
MYLLLLAGKRAPIYSRAAGLPISIEDQFSQ